MSIVGVEKKMCKNNNVCILPVVIAVILGIVIGALFFVGTIGTEIITIPLIIGIIFAIITLILLYNTAVYGNKKETKECVCEYGRCLALGGLVTLVSSFLALTFAGTLAIGAIISALLIGIFGFGLILNFLSFVGLLVCLINNNCYRNIYCKYDNE